MHLVRQVHGERLDTAAEMLEEHPDPSFRIFDRGPDRRQLEIGPGRQALQVGPGREALQVVAPHCDPRVRTNSGCLMLYWRALNFDAHVT